MDIDYKNTRCSQGSGDKADEISNNTTTEGKDDSVPGTGVGEEEIFDLGLAFSRFYGFSRRDRVGEESSPGVCNSGGEFSDEGGEV